MASVIKFAKGVRNHWKKSTIFALSLAYGANYAKEQYETQILMKEYCLKARNIGDQSIPDGVQPRTITVILNPTANRRKATKQFEKYCAPLLHLAGICVDVLQTESEGHARSLVDNLKKADAIIVAGGDGTVSEVITGLFRKSGEDQYENPCPIGILPLGRTNTIGKILFPGGETLTTVRSLADASMAIIKESTKKVDVMKIEILDHDTTTVKQTEPSTEQKNDEKQETNENEPESNETLVEPPVKEPLKPIYALGSIQWGPYRDAESKQDKYWYYGSLRKYATYIFNGYKSNLSWECIADVNYLLPCEGCSNCYIKPKEEPRRWWSRFVSKPKLVGVDYSKVVNSKCSEKHSKEISTTDFLLRTSNALGNDLSQLHLNIGPKETDYVDFVREGFKTLNGEDRSIVDAFNVRQIEVLPKIDGEKQVWFSIDKEEYEARPIRITLLPKVLNVYCL